MPTPATSTSHDLRLKADLMLLIVAIIWGTAFVVQRLIAVKSGVYWFNGARFLVAGLALIPAARRLHLGGDLPGLNRKTLAYVLASGSILTAAAGLQQAGLRSTTAGNAGFITGLYVVFVPVVAALILRQAVRPVIWLAAGLSVVGMYLLSVAESLYLNQGDLLELIGALFWALHVIMIGWAVQRMNVLHFAVGQSLVCGMLNLALGALLEGNLLPALLHDWWAVAYAGLVSVGLGYTLQAVAQRHAPPSDAVILLSLESVFAALSGWLFLDERLSPVQFLGCAIIFAAMLLAQLANEHRPAENVA